MRRLEKYPKYKDSGVEWIGEIPEGWTIKRVKSLSRVKRGASPRPIDDPRYFDDEGEYAWVRIADVTANDHYLRTTTQKLSKLGASLSVKLQPNKLFLSIAGSVGKPMISDIKCCIHDGFVYFPELKFNQEFLYRVFETGRPYVGLGKTGTQLNLNTDSVGGISIPIPTENEINAIISFINSKTTQIDKAISLKEQMIERLKERRQILINDAVTKGLDKTVKMKDSGVEWIGEIPEHWEVFPGLRVFSENKRKNTGMLDDRVLSLSYGRIIRKPKEKLVGLVPESFETYQIVKAGDIIIRCTDLQNDKVSLRTALAKDDGIITSAYLNLNVKNGSSEYLHYFLYVLDITKAIYKLGSGLRQNLSFDDFKRLDIIFPPLEEQKQIVKYIEEQTKKIDYAITLQQKQIEKLKEYKATLIDSVVTGKVRVCDD